MGMDGSASKRSVLRTGLGEFVSLFDMDDLIFILFFKGFFSRVVFSHFLCLGFLRPPGSTRRFFFAAVLSPRIDGLG